MKITIDARVLRAMFRAALRATGDKSARFDFDAVRVDVVGRSLAVTSTNGAIAMRWEEPGESVDGAGATSAVVPGPHARAALAMLDASLDRLGSAHRAHVEGEDDDEIAPALAAAINIGAHTVEIEIVQRAIETASGSVGGGTVAMSFPPGDRARFPDVAKAIAEAQGARPPSRGTTIAARYLDLAARIFGDASGATHAPIDVRAGEGFDPSLLTSEVVAGLSVVVMPCRSALTLQGEDARMGARAPRAEAGADG